MTAADVQNLLAGVRAVDRDSLALLATLTHALPWWGRAAATIVRDGPVAALYLWLLAFLVAPAGDDTRPAQARALAAALVLGVVWAVLWAVVPLRTHGGGFALAAARQAAVSGLPLGAALLALGGGGGGAVGLLLRLLVMGYALARLAIGADGPVRVLVEALSALAGALLFARVGVLRRPLARWARAFAQALGLDADSAPPAVRGRASPSPRRS